MSKNQTIPEFDENFFSSFAVPKVKDYSRLSSSPSRDQPCDSSYFEKHFPILECDTPVKMRIPEVERESEDALPTPSMDNFLSSSSSSETTVNVDQRDTVEAPVKQNHITREPLKIVPTEAASAKSYGESQLIEGLEKLTMFAPKAPEERLSQRRRSEQRKKQEEETKRRSVMPAASGIVPPNRTRSISSKRSISREPSGVVAREPSVPRSRHNSVTRTISAPISTGGGVVTRAMAARAAETTSKPTVRRSIMPIKVAQKTPVLQMKKDAAPGSGDRSRDRTRRNNTTGASSVRRSVMPDKPAGSTTPVAPPRRSASANKTSASASKITPKTRPIAIANRSSMLRMNMVKPTAPPASLAADTDAQQKRMLARPTVPGVATARTRQPLRVNPTTPSSTFKKPALQSSGQRPTRQPLTRTRSVDRVGQQPPVTTGTPSQKTSRADLFNRLATPKSTATPARVSHDGPSTSVRRLAVRPVPSYVYSVNKGMPSAGGLHGIRAPSKERVAQKAASNIDQSKQ